MRGGKHYEIGILKAFEETIPAVSKTFQKVVHVCDLLFGIDGSRKGKKSRKNGESRNNTAGRGCNGSIHGRHKQVHTHTQYIVYT